MEYKLSEQELKDLMHRSWLKAKNFYSGNTDEYFYDYFESEKKQLTIHVVSQQRELLRFMEYLSTYWGIDDVIDCTNGIVYDFVA
ncbi:hypothetical protein [Algibacter sp. PT7-4]|uniref:hypothetical protein n=1 Tax=Algibacter ulvanivorans TaxID=3400999 RepID=UPI003AAC129D